MFPRILLVLTGLIVGLLSACGPGGEPTSTPTPSATPIERLNTAQMALPRIDFCSLVGDASVAAVLDANKWDASGWDNGEHAPITAEVEDVVAEHLCEWKTADGEATARAWIFARPVKRTFAKRIARAERRTSGCVVRKAPDFGDPSVFQLCRFGEQNRVRHEGLFADTWFGCELSAAAPRKQVRKRADAWCSELVSQFNTTR